jgi:catechol 2,3-dioxygenase-like lactoylglutathione lyase family enzyme
MATHEDTSRKFHTSLNVRDFDRSVAFYRVLLGAEPVRLMKDYAKFELADPPLVLSLIPGETGTGSLNHMGLRVRDAEELVEFQRRLEAAGHATTREDGVACCYSRQTKFWITDPDRALWEIYVLHEDIEERGSAAPPRVVPVAIGIGVPPAPRIWEHRLTDPIPVRIPCDDNSLHDIRLEGSINAGLDDTRQGLLGECLRALRPGATIHLHGLSGDRATESPPSLPGPAAAVQYVPATGEIVDALVRTGFVDVRIEKLSETACFVVDGVSLREVGIAARKPGHRPKTATHHAVYLGPMRQVTDDFGNVFTRGVVTSLNVHDWQVLSTSEGRHAFLFLKPETSKDGVPRANRPTTVSADANRIDDRSSGDAARTAR